MSLHFLYAHIFFLYFARALCKLKKTLFQFLNGNNYPMTVIILCFANLIITCKIVYKIRRVILFVLYSIYEQYSFIHLEKCISWQVGRKLSKVFQVLTFEFAQILTESFLNLFATVPPRIHHVSSQGVMEVKRGASITLECRASGNPVPVITWTRKVSYFPTVFAIEDSSKRVGGVICADIRTGERRGT